MTRFRSGRVTHQNIGISSFTENKTVLDVIGNALINGLLNVTGISTFGQLDVSGHTELDNLSVSGVSTFVGTVNTASIVSTGIDLNGDIDVDGHTELDNVNISGVATATQVHTGSVTGPSTITIDPAGIGDNTGKVVIAGDLQVDGTTTTVNSTELTIVDKNILIAKGSADDTQADGGGITIESGDGNKTFQFEATGDNLGSSENLNLASSKEYKIDNISVLNATTLGNGVVNSSLTNVGTLTSLNVSGIASVGAAITMYPATGIVSAFAFYGDGSNLENTGATLNATSGVERLVTTQLTSGTMVDAATDADLTYDATTDTLSTPNLKVGTGVTVYGNAGIVSAISFYGDGANLTNTGASLVATSGVERLVTTKLTFGTMVDAATDSDLTYDASTDTLNVENIKILGGISTNGSFYGNDSDFLVSTATGWKWTSVPGIFAVGNILNGFNVREEGVVVGTAGSIHTLDFRGNNIVVSADPQPNGIATITLTESPTFNNLTVNGSFYAGGVTGASGQVLQSTGTGIQWTTLPDVRSANTFIATAGQTIFTVNYNTSFVDVYVNGVKLTESEYNASSGSSITLYSACFAGDVVEVISYNTVAVGGGGGGSANVIGINTAGTSGFTHINASGVVTATAFYGGAFYGGSYFGDGSNLTGIAATDHVRTGSLVVSGISTFNGRIVGAATSNVIPFLYANYSDLPSASTYHGAFAHVHATGRGYFAHAGNWLELVNRDTDGNVSVAGTITANNFSGDGSKLTNVTAVGLTGIPNVTVGDITANNISVINKLTYEDVTNVDSIGIVTARSGIHVNAGYGIDVQSGVVTATTFDGNAVTASTATVAQGLTGRPAIDVRHIDATGIKVTGIVTALTLVGNLVGSVQGGNVNAYNGVFTNNVSAGASITASLGFYGDGSNISGIVSISDNAPISPSTGDLWWKSDEGSLKIYYQDIDSAAWIDASPGGSGGSGGGGNSDLINDITPQLGGNLDANGKNIVLGDSSSSSNSRLAFGAGSDLQIYHDGFNSYIRDAGSGNLRITGNSSAFMDLAATKTSALFNPDTSVELSYNGSKKFETTNTGVKITGDIDLGTGDLTTTGKIYYSNNFANSVDLPSASTYHGMFAHVHAEGHGYFAHAGAWTQLLDTSSSLSELANVSTTAPSTNDVLKWDGSNWGPSASSSNSNNYISVKDYGAAGNGEADDTDEIQNAIDAAASAGGGTVFIPAGIYMIKAASSSEGSGATQGWMKDGGLLLKPKVHLVGAGTSTILRNLSNNWQSMIRIGGGDDIGIRSLTIDGDSNNKTPNTRDQSPIRGEGIIAASVEGGTGNAVNNLVIDDVKIINTGHYGIGLQDVAVSNAKLTNLTFANIGGDCIDIKSTTAYTTSGGVNVPAYPKEGIIIDNVFVKDGCGHNASGTANVGHQQQACIDVGGTCRVTNVHIEGLETYTDKDTGAKLDGCAGVRFRAPVISAHRLGSEGSSGSNIYVDCVQAIGSGSGTEERVYGVAIHDSNITLNNVRVNQTYTGVIITNSGDGVPAYCSVNNIVATNIKGDTNSRGIRVGAHQRGCVVSGITTSCDTGLHVDGVANNFDVVVQNCTTAADIPSPSTISGKVTVDNGTSTIVTTYSGDNIQSGSTPTLLFNSTKNSGSWAANDDPMGAIKVESADTSGPTNRGMFGLFPTGQNNSSSRWKFDVDGNINIFDIRTDVVQTTAVFKLPERAMSQLPTPSSVYRGSLSFANTSRGFQLVFCDGTNWLYQDTRQIIS